MAFRILGVACSLLASAAGAHPGHGASSAASWLHGLEPAHLAPALLLAVGALVLAWKRITARERR
jgi:hypothetical protein